MDETSAEIIKAALLEVVGNQLRDNDPPETKTTYKRLKDSGMSEEEAKLCITEVLHFEMSYILEHKELFNAERYARNLANLPDEPSL